MADTGAMTLTERHSSASGAEFNADSAKNGCALTLFSRIEDSPPAVPEVELCCEHYIESVSGQLKYEAQRVRA